MPPFTGRQQHTGKVHRHVKAHTFLCSLPASSTGRTVPGRSCGTTGCREMHISIHTGQLAPPLHSNSLPPFPPNFVAANTRHSRRFPIRFLGSYSELTPYRQSGYHKVASSVKYLVPKNPEKYRQRQLSGRLTLNSRQNLHFGPRESSVEHSQDHPLNDHANEGYY